MNPLYKGTSKNFEISFLWIRPGAHMYLEKFKSKPYKVEQYNNL
jgi:hypothetical protein